MVATSIYFNGRTTVRPGAYSEVDASGLAVVGLGAVGIVALLGEASGGEPQTVTNIVNPGSVGRTFREGDLLEGGNILFDPSKDDAIPGGAAAVKFVKVNPSTQSARTLTNSSGDALTLTSVDYGVHTTQISYDLSDGTTQGKAIVITDHANDVEETIDDIGGDKAFSLLYTAGANGATTMTAALDNASGVEAEFTKTAAGKEDAYDGEIGSISGLDGDADNPITAGEVVDIVSADNADDSQTVTIIGTDNATGDPVTETLSLNGTTPVSGTQAWAAVHAVVLSATCAGDVSVSDNSDSDVLFVISAGDTITGGGANDLSGEVLEAGGAEISLVADGASTADVIVVGTDESDATAAEVLTLNGTTPVASTGKWNSVQYLALGLVAAGVTLTLSGLLWNEGDVVRAVSDNAADTSQTLTVYGIDNDGNGQTEAISLNGTTSVEGTATWKKVLGVALSAATTGTITVSPGASEDHSITVFSFDGSASNYAGFTPIDNLSVSSSAVTVNDDGSDELPVLLVGLDASGDAQAAVATLDGSANATSETWSEITGIAVGHIDTGRTVTLSGKAFDLAVASFDTVSDVINQVNGLSGWTATVGPNGGPLAVENLDNKTATDVTSELDFSGDLAHLIAAVNDNSGIVTAAKASGATGVPDNTSGDVYLLGGVEGTTSFSDWQAALDLLRDEDVNTVVPLTDDAAVHAATVAHCAYMCGAGRKERDCVLGAASGISLSDAKDAAVELNTRHARLLIQDMVRYNTDGEREQFPPYFHAAVAAGMQAGSDVGESLTAKYSNVLNVVNDSTYNLIDNGEELINGGILVQEKVEGRGFRWLRNVTTYLQSTNIAYIEASVNEAVNYSAYNIRTNLEFAVGQKGFAGTANAMLANVLDTLEELVAEDIVVAWRNLTVTIEGDVATVDVELAPVNPINFIKTTLHLVTADFAAAA